MPVKKTKKTPSKVKSPKITKKPADASVVVKTKAEEILKRLGFKGTVIVTAREQGGYAVQLDSDQASLLIGYHGQTLSSFQLILSLAVQKETGSWMPIILNVGDYREHREEQLRRLALNVAQRVRFSGQPQTISHLNSAERRIVHLTLSEDEMVETVSEGEGSARQLIVRPKLLSS